MSNEKTQIKIIAKIIDAGKCRYYKQGQSFTIGGFTPKGMCVSAYMAVIRDAQAMRYGAKMPWEKDGKILTRCPDPEGALWQLEKVEES